MVLVTVPEPTACTPCHPPPPRSDVAITIPARRDDVIADGPKAAGAWPCAG
jgi:hypothetical protein